MRAGALAVWVLVTPLLAWTAVRLLGLESGYLLVALIAYTPYAIAVAIGVLIFAAGLRCWSAMAVATVIAVALTVAIAPRTRRDAPAPPRSARILRVLTANVELGHASAAAIVALVARERVDVLSVQELTPAMVAGLDEAGLPARLPHRVIRPLPGAAGTGLYARSRLLPVTAPAGTTFAMAAARVWVPGAHAVDLVAVHASAPRARSGAVRWRHDLRALPPARSGHPRILVGDFNATLDHCELRRLIDTGYTDAAAAAGAGLVPTWPSGRLLPPPITIDHVLVDARWRVGRVHVERVPGSDHRALLAELLPPSDAHDAQSTRLLGRGIRTPVTGSPQR